MTSDRSRLVPLLSFEVDATGAAAQAIPARLCAFAQEHGVGESVRARLEAIAAEAVATLAAAPAAGPIRVEADIDAQELQAVIARDVGSNAAVATLRSLLAELDSRSDGFSTDRAGATGIEIWICFRIGGSARSSAA